MKKREHLFEAIGLVDDRLVEEAAGARRSATPWKKWAALAACLVLVLGLGSVSMTFLFRGCSSSAPNTTSDSAATESASDSASAPGESGTDGFATGGDSAATTDDSAAESDSAATDSGEAVPGEGEKTAWAGPVMPLDTLSEGISATRQVTLLAEDGSAQVRDAYQVTNGSDADQIVTFTYPLGAGAEATEHTVTVEGEVVATEWFPAADAPLPQMQADAALSGLAQASFARLSFAVEIPAGGTVEIRVDTVVPATVLDDGTQYYEVLSMPGEGLVLTEQTAVLELENSQGTLLDDSFGFADGQPVILDPEEGLYTLQLQFP